MIHRAVSPLLKFVRCVHKIIFGTNVVAIKNVSGHMAGYAHGRLFRDPTTNQVPNCRPSKIMNFDIDFGRCTHLIPSSPKIPHLVPIFPGEQRVVRLLPKDVRERQFDRFQQNIDQTGAGLPRLVGIERPTEIRKRIEADEAQKQQDLAKQQGATHAYDPSSGRIIPSDA